MTSVALVGNDVVDLRDPAIAADYQRTRFVARVCTRLEIARIESSHDPHRTLWALFAAKEAGFKVVAKLTPGIAFSPRRFVVDAQLSSVTHDVARLWLRVMDGEDWVHAVAGQGVAEPVWAVERRPRQVTESAAVRELATRVVADHLGLDREGLAVERAEDDRFRDGLGPPRLLHDGVPLDLDLSLSHDGPWVACALLGQAGAAASPGGV
jgi:phosphopantetheinyl transferase (holo-ACP synthase)